jgi:hypothetical protein
MRAPYFYPDHYLIVVVKALSVEITIDVWILRHAVIGYPVDRILHHVDFNQVTRLD